MPLHIAVLSSKTEPVLLDPVKCFEGDSWDEMHKQKILLVGLFVSLCHPLASLRCKEIEGWREKSRKSPPVASY